MEADAGSRLTTIIFDLSEVLIPGLLGIERQLAARFGVTERELLEAFGGDNLYELCCGRLSEDAYLEAIREAHGWELPGEEAKALIRENFNSRVPGMEGLVERLGEQYRLVLLSDHAAEWAAHIRAIHPFLERFDALFFSYELGETKRNPATFRRVLEQLGRSAEECLFIDDSASNVGVAQAVGMAAIRFLDADQLEQALAEQGVLAPNASTYGGSDVP